MNSEKLLSSVKQAVKQLVEEAVTRRFIHQDSANITALCVELDKAITFGLQSRHRRRWSTLTSADVLQLLGRHHKPAQELSKRSQEIISIIVQHSSLSFFSGSRNSLRATNGDSGGWRQKLFSTYSSALSHRGHERFLWIRIALIEKTLTGLVEELVRHSSTFYEANSLIGDPVRGPIIASLLAGPCALSYSRMKTPDHRQIEQPAEELVLKERFTGKHDIPSPHNMERARFPAPRSESPTTVNGDMNNGDAFSNITALYQNPDAALIYGKNNVLVEACPGRLAPGYLSVHQLGPDLLLKWTPNDLVTGGAKANTLESMNSPTTPGHQSIASPLTVNLSEVVCIHCHPYVGPEGEDANVETQRVQLILQDGTSLSPIGLQHGSTLLSFLAMLETSLLPGVRLDPPLWGQHDEPMSILAPPWPIIAKQHSSPALTGLPPTSANRPLNRKGSLLGRRIEMTDLPGYFGGSQQYNTKKRLDKGCIFHLVPTGQSIPQGETQAFDELFSKVAKDDDGPRGRTPDVDHQPSSSSGASSKPTPAAVSQTPQYIERSESGTQRSVEDLSRMAMARMKERIKSRTFYGWLMYCRDMRIVRNHLGKLLMPVSDSRTVHVNGAALEQWGGGLTDSLWEQLMTHNGVIGNPNAVMKYVFFGGIHDDKNYSLRRQVWPYLLEFYSVGSTPTQRTLQMDEVRKHYDATLVEWLAMESDGKEMKADELAECEQRFADIESRSDQLQAVWDYKESARRNRVPASEGSSRLHSKSGGRASPASSVSSGGSGSTPPATQRRPHNRPKAKGRPSSGETAVLDLGNSTDDCCTCQRGVASVNGAGADTVDGLDASAGTGAFQSKAASTVITYRQCPVCGKPQQQQMRQDLSEAGSGTDEPDGQTANAEQDNRSSPSTAKYHSYDPDLDTVELWSRELHKIDKDVVRCDRTNPYFVPANLVKLRNVLATYVWEHRPPTQTGYTQGMVDLLAPIMMVFDDEVMAYGCFCKLMERMDANFPHGKAMDNNFFNMRLLFEVYDRELFELMKSNEDYTHFFFTYRWYLLDLKRELPYDDILRCWECIWASRHCCTEYFTIFLCTALVHIYRDIILKNNMDFTEIIKFFNDMAEKHCLREILSGARDIVEYLQKLLNETREGWASNQPSTSSTS